MEPDQPPLLPCQMCPKRAVTVVLCDDAAGQPFSFVHWVGCGDHPPQLLCPHCRVLGVTTVVQGG